MMRWDQIHWEQCEWRIPDTKNGEPVLVALTDRAIDILKERYTSSESSWVFPQEDDNDKHFADPKKGWPRALERATFYFWLKDNKIGPWVADIQNESPHLPPQMLFKEAVAKAKNKKMELPASLLDIRMHDIRRTFGSYQAITGASLQVIGKSMGHKSTQATQIYARLNLNAVRSSVEKATEAMFQL